MSVQMTILGCGNSSGTPSIGNFWGNCDPNEPKNRRLRPSIAIQSDTTTIIVDTGPDFKQQINNTNIQKIDAVLYTHSHADHIHGIDDLRVFRHRFKQTVPIYCLPKTLEDIKGRFEYLFQHGGGGLYPIVVEPYIYEDENLCLPQTVGDIEFIPFKQDHGTSTSLGFRFGDTAYSTDMVDLDDQAIDILQGIKTWVVDGAGYNFPQNPVHCTLEKVLQLNERVQAEKLFITHLTTLMDYKTLCEELPEYAKPAHDGLVLPISYNFSVKNGLKDTNSAQS